MASRLNLARMGAAVLGATTALMLSVALPANAASTHGDSNASGGAGTSATVAPQSDIWGGKVMESFPENGKNQSESAQTALIALKLANGKLAYTYCVELTVSLKNGTMQQTGWDSYPDKSAPFNTNNTKINWILHHSYPVVQDLGALATSAGVSGKLSSTDAITATQAAIWHYSDNATLGLSSADAAVGALYKYLTGSQNVGQAQPAGSDTANGTPTLSLNPTTDLAGNSGDKIGPFTVSTNFSQVELNAELPTGVALTDASGTKIDTSKVANGTKIYFDVPAGTASGYASLTLSTPDTIGELFVGTAGTDNSGGRPQLQTHGQKANCSPTVSTQSLIIAQAPLSATAKVNWVASVASPSTTPTPGTTTAPSTSTSTTPATTSTTPAVVAPTTTDTITTGGGSGSLPFTGVSIIVPAALAVVLIGAGGGFLLLQRRRGKRA
ncbi:MAG TPA: thioester domain-containing protein [Pseudonocardiaceae bacterium]|jgi:TQXA domain-containing protein|nr:thioester domain-containing protein [Pseudonocardiaceae bacterium]